MTMTREEAKDILKAIQALICPNKESVLENNFSEAFNMAIEALSAEAEWIPCSERLPNTTEQVLISVCDDHGDKPYHYTCVGWKCEECWISNNDYVFGVVIAWMPLPKPYREDGEA